MTQLTEVQKEIRAILDNLNFDFIDAWEIEEWRKNNYDIEEKLLYIYIKRARNNLLRPCY